MEDQSNEQTPFRVLSLDGGGIRGLYTACVLNTLSERFSPSKALDIGGGFDLIVGTSTGGLLAVALAHGVPLSTLMQFYREKGSRIFTDPFPGDSKFGMVKWYLRNFLSSANQNGPLREALVSLFGNTTIEEMYTARNIAVCVPSIRLEKHTPHVFKTPHIKGKHRDNKYSLVNVCLATAAAPVYFPMVPLQSPVDAGKYDVFLDGGLWANDPVLIGIIEALEICAGSNRPIHILSIGTSALPSGESLRRDKTNHGTMKWLAKGDALRVAMNAQEKASKYMSTFLIKHLHNEKRAVQLVRIKESPASPAQTKQIELDLATNESLKVLSDLGDFDGTEAYRLTHDAQNVEGQIISNVFKSMPVWEV